MKLIVKELDSKGTVEITIDNFDTVLYSEVYSSERKEKLTKNLEEVLAILKDNK